MIVTIILSIITMIGLFFMLLSAVGFIQNKCFFTSVPKNVKAVIKDREERFPGAHLIGWIMLILSILVMGSAFAFGGWDGIKKGFGFWRLFERFFDYVAIVESL